MNRIRTLEKRNEQELQRGLVEKGSWHEEFKDSPYIYVGGFNRDLTEGDLLTVFSQYGEITDINLVRDKETGQSKGFAFLAYEDNRGTILAVDNFNGIKVADRTIRVDHVLNYRSPEELEKEKEQRKKQRTKYADLVTEELFKTGSYQLSKISTSDSHEVTEQHDGLLVDEGEMLTENTRNKRKRTPEEQLLRKRFKNGEISLEEYDSQKKLLKNSVKSRPS